MKMLSLFLLTSFLVDLSFATQSPAVSATKTIDLSNQESKVEFKAVGKPSMLKINGTQGKLKGSVEINGQTVNGEFLVPLDSMTTGIALRDEHMKKKYLETEKFPNAILKIKDLKLDKNILSENSVQKNVPFKGFLSVRGSEAPVEGTVDIESTAKIISIIARTKTNITAHKIDIPNYLGVKVADVIDILTELKITK